MAQSKFNTDAQGELWLESGQIARSPGHPFYARLNQVLRAEGFDRQAEALCAPYYKEGGRPAIPTGVYFRMLLTGYFEGLDSQRAIAWRCADSLALREFLGIALTERTPDHSTLTRIRQRLPLEIHEQIFALVLAIARRHKLLRGKTLLVDATTLEANAAMRSIVRRDTGENWKEYVTRLASEDGLENLSAEELARYDQQRADKKVSNEDWQSKSDPEARIAKMKDGRTHLAYKAEHAVDAASGVIVAVGIEPAGSSDAETLKPRVIEAQANLIRAGSRQAVREVVGDKGYHKLETLVWTSKQGIETYLPEKKERGQRDWSKHTRRQRRAHAANARRMQSRRGRRLMKKRGELIERSFAHVCNSGGGRRAWLRGAVNVAKQYLLRVAAFNLGVVMRKLFEVGKPRALQGARKGLLAGENGLLAVIFFILRAWIAANARLFFQSHRSTGRPALFLDPISRVLLLKKN
jgi:transposase